MVIKVTKSMARNVFTGVIETEVSSRELIYIDAYGEPQVDIGGTIPLVDPENNNAALLDEDEQPRTISLTSKQTYIRSGFPVSYSFDGNIDAEASIKLHSWITELTTRLTTAKTTLMAKDFPVTPDITVTEV